MNEPEVIDELVRIWGRDIAPTMRADCCVAAARATSLVLDYYGVPNKVLACELFVFNDAALAELERGNEDYRTWPEGAWSIGAGHHSPGGGYAGHLIVRTHSGTLIDLSAGQFNRPGRIAIDGPRVWTHHEVRNGVVFVREGDVLFSFSLTGNPSYRNAPDWKRGHEVAALIIRAINNERIGK